MRRGALVLAALAGAMPILSATPVSATPAGPDLAVLAVTPSVPTATPGQRVTVEVVAVNHGPGAGDVEHAVRRPVEARLHSGGGGDRLGPTSKVAGEPGRGDAHLVQVAIPVQRDLVPRGGHLGGERRVALHLLADRWRSQP